MFVSCAGKFYANAELNRIEARARASHAFARGSYHSVFILYVVGRSEPKKLCEERTLGSINIPQSTAKLPSDRNVKATRTSAERTNKQKRLHPFEAKTKTRTERMGLKHSHAWRDPLSSVMSRHHVTHGVT